ncbi:hypothetical protein ABH19_07355 [Leptospirillum sp. Group II 'CF-1']|nr:hypothetical protein ABH19_07355 [Leptospirillum sp. Group II 'CF-1']
MLFILLYSYKWNMLTVLIVVLLFWLKVICSWLQIKMHPGMGRCLKKSIPINVILDQNKILSSLKDSYL